MDEKEIFNGAPIEDARPESAKKKDYNAEEVNVLTGSVESYQHDKPTKLDATKFRQWYTSSCVPHAFLTQLEYEGLLTPKLASQLRLYRKRPNYPQAGCNGVEMYEQIKDGLSTNAEMPVKSGMREAEANALENVKGVQGLVEDFSYFQITQANYAKIPAYVASGKAVAVFVYATEEEWSKQYVDIIDQDLKISEAYVTHAVVLMPEGDFTEGGVRRLSVHDSGLFNSSQLRYISEEFWKKRVYFASIVVAKNTELPVIQATNKLPTEQCELGNSGDDVLKLQSFLASGGFLEQKYITGYYGALTAKAVLWYQLSKWQKFSNSIPELLDLKGEHWGQQSINSLS